MCELDTFFNHVCQTRQTSQTHLQLKPVMVPTQLQQVAPPSDTKCTVSDEMLYHLTPKLTGQTGECH